MKRSFLFLAVLLLASCNLVQAPPTALPASPTTFPSTIDIKVYFTNLKNFNVGTEPYETAVTRTVPATDNIPEAVLLQLFKGPTDEEKAQGLDVFKSGATGFSQFAVEDGVARVYLTGDCASNGATYTIANLLDANLKQFPEIKWVKVYDQNGETETPTGQSGSIPFCLEP